MIEPWTLIRISLFGKSEIFMNFNHFNCEILFLVLLVLPLFKSVVGKSLVKANFLLHYFLQWDSTISIFSRLPRSFLYHLGNLHLIGRSLLSIVTSSVIFLISGCVIFLANFSSRIL
jgi:hypothetical protein